jgi:hypothetical protein
MDLLGNLRARGWSVDLATTNSQLLPLEVAARYPSLPRSVTTFLSKLDRCINREEDAWFLTRQFFAAEPGEGFRWNEFEMMAIDSISDEPSRVGDIRRFWDNHFPFMVAVHSDYDYLAVRLSSEGFGQIVHGCAPEWEEPSVVSGSFTDFLELFAIAAASDSAGHPFAIFLGDGGARGTSQPAPEPVD